MRIALAAVGALIGIVASAASVEAAPSCSVEALTALRVPDLSVTDAKPMAATGAIPAHCDVRGTVVTKGGGVAEGLARFAMQLPEAWQQRFLFLGVGGNAGSLNPSANETDRNSALGKGYTTILTDTGHVGDGTTAQWTRLPDGQPDAVKKADFAHRAAHSVTVAGKAFAEAYYATKVKHAYFDGCSTGGRMALMAAGRYPEDFDGVISGDPLISSITSAARTVVQRAALSSPAAYIPEPTIAAIDARVTARCDAIDGVKDGLVQNPSACPVRAEDLLCRTGETEACLNADQVRVLRSYTSSFRDSRGKVVFGPWAITDLAGTQGLAYNITGRAAPDLSDLASPWKSDAKAAPRSWALVKEMLAHWFGLGPAATVADMDVDPDTNTIGDRLLGLLKANYAEGDVRDPAALKPFIAQGRKLILYHGASDPSIPVSQSIAFYGELVEQQEGIARTQETVRLFLVPGMHHCSGGPGPDRFDTLSALEAWVEQGKAPETIQASTRPTNPVQHRLPLCPYPQQARYRGTGETGDAANWSCVAGE
jgi:feruloyl esterase